MKKAGITAVVLVLISLTFGALTILPESARAIEINMVATLPLRWVPVVSDLDNDGNKEISGQESSDPFDMQVYERTGDNAYSLVLSLPSIIPWDSGDADGDGLAELLSQGFGEIILYEAPNRFSFPSEVVWRTNRTYGGPANAKIADLDRDGRKELIFVDDGLEIWENTGDNAFAFVSSIEGGVGDFMIDDFDGDKRTDIIIGDVDGNIYVVENVGDDDYVVAWNHTLPHSHAYSYAAGDLDYDGKGDFIVTTHSIGISYQLTMFESVGDDDYVEVWSKAMPVTGGGLCSLGTGDVDDDGLTEFAYTNSNDIYIFEGSGDNDFVEIWNHSASHTKRVVIDDTDNDGLSEVIFKTDSDTMAIFERVGDPSPIDLWMADWHVSFSPSSRVTVGHDVRIQSAVHNIGIADATDVTVRFYEGNVSSGTRIGDYVVPLVPANGGSALAEVVWSSFDLGSYEICVFADPDNNVTESNEDNNVGCKFLEVVPPPRPPRNLDARLSGWKFQDVTLNWTLSADDDSGNGSAVRYDIHRSEVYDATKAEYELLESLPSGTNAYVDTLAGEGNPSNYFYYICASDAFNESSCTPNQAAKFTRPLFPGPNLVSIPLIQSNESVETVLQTVQYDKAWFYDSSSQEWKWYMASKTYRRGLWNVNHTMGLWVNVTENSNLTVAGIVPARTTIHLHEGWNLVSFPSVNASFTVADLKASVPVERVEGFNPAPPYLLRVLLDSDVLPAGRAYWVKVQADVVWTVWFG